jgi:hypothetical protein
VLTCRLISDLENPYADLSQYNDYAAPNDDADRDDDYVEDISDNEVSYSALGSTRFTSHLDFASCANALAADVLQQHAPRGQASGPEGIRAFRVHGRLAARLRLLHRLQQDVCRPEVRSRSRQAPTSIALRLTLLLLLCSDLASHTLTVSPPGKQSHESACELPLRRRPVGLLHHLHAVVRQLAAARSERRQLLHDEV